MRAAAMHQNHIGRIGIRPGPLAIMDFGLFIDGFFVLWGIGQRILKPLRCGINPFSGRKQVLLATILRFHEKLPRLAVKIHKNHCL